MQTKVRVTLPGVAQQLVLGGRFGLSPDEQPGWSDAAVSARTALHDADCVPMGKGVSARVTLDNDEIDAVIGYFESVRSWLAAKPSVQKSQDDWTLQRALATALDRLREARGS